MGKSLYRKNLCDALRQKEGLRGKDLTIPIYRHVNTDDIVGILRAKLKNALNTRSYDTIHIDVAPEVNVCLNILLTFHDI